VYEALAEVEREKAIAYEWTREEENLVSLLKEPKIEQ